MKNLFVGTSGWAYPKWKPGFYPKEATTARFLEHYAGRLNSVEVNFTFRSTVKPDLAARWCDATPESFLFSLKAPMRITHLKRLRETAESVAHFADSLSVFRERKKLGPVLIQLPENFKCDLERLRNFLAEWPRDVMAAFEFRHESWFVEETYAALKRAGCALCYAEAEDLTTPAVRTADFEYWRLRKARYIASRVIKKIQKREGAGDLFVYLKHEDSPANALVAAQVFADADKGAGSIAVKRKASRKAKR
jgi:uncharacterized protein YecE (DUF72 family)